MSISTCVVYIWHLVLVPQDGFCGIQWQLIDDLRLEAPPLIGADHDLHQEIDAVCPGVVLRD